MKLFPSVLVIAVGGLVGAGGVVVGGGVGGCLEVLPSGGGKHPRRPRMNTQEWTP